MLGLISVMTCLAVINAQTYTCPSSQTGIMISGTGLGGLNGYYQAKSQEECCYNCFVVNKTACAGYSYFLPQKYCFLASSIALLVPNVGSNVLTGTNPNFVSAVAANAAASSTKNTATTTTTTLAGGSGNTAAANTAPTTTTIPTPAPTTTQLIQCFVANNSDLAGGDLYQTLATGPEDCCNKCGNAPKAGYPCAGWTYKRSVNTCYIKYVNPVTHPNLNINAGADFISGSVTSSSGR